MIFAVSLADNLWIFALNSLAYFALYLLLYFSVSIKCSVHTYVSSSHVPVYMYITYSGSYRIALISVHSCMTLDSALTYGPVLTILLLVISPPSWLPPAISTQRLVYGRTLQV